MPEINLGIMPGAGASQRLTRIVGMGWARHLLFTGNPIDSDTALKIGLVTMVLPREKLMEEARKMARTLASRSPIALRTAKKCLMCRKM